MPLSSHNNRIANQIRLAERNMRFGLRVNGQLQGHNAFGPMQGFRVNGQIQGINNMFGQIQPALRVNGQIQGINNMFGQINQGLKAIEYQEKTKMARDSVMEAIQPEGIERQEEPDSLKIQRRIFMVTLLMAGIEVADLGIDLADRLAGLLP